MKRYSKIDLMGGMMERVRRREEKRNSLNDNLPCSDNNIKSNITISPKSTSFLGLNKRNRGN